MIRKITASLLMPLMFLVITVGCSTETEQQVLNLALNAFIAAMAITNPGWSNTKLVADVGAGIAAWNGQAGWQDNVVKELTLAESDVVDVPNCNNECQALSVVFLSALASAIKIAQENAPSGAVVARAQGRALPAGVKIYKNSYFGRRSYVADWNKVAPNGAKLK